MWRLYAWYDLYNSMWLGGLLLREVQLPAVEQLRLCASRCILSVRAQTLEDSTDRSSNPTAVPFPCNRTLCPPDTLYIECTAGPPSQMTADLTAHDCDSADVSRTVT